MTKHWLSSVTLVSALVLSGLAHAQIKMGVASAITGPNAAFGADMVNGTQKAVDDINKAGGILGQQITLEWGDDAADPKQGVSVANKFVGDGVKPVVGHMTSGATIPASEVYSEHGILMITPSTTNPKVTDSGLWGVFRTSGRDDQQGMLWAELARDKLKDKKIAVVYDNTTYGKGLADAALDNMHKFGVLQRDPHDLRRVDDAGAQHVDILLGLGIEAEGRHREPDRGGMTQIIAFARLAPPAL